MNYSFNKCRCGRIYLINLNDEKLCKQKRHDIIRVCLSCGYTEKIFAINSTVLRHERLHEYTKIKNDRRSIVIMDVGFEKDIVISLYYQKNDRTPYYKYLKYLGYGDQQINDIEECIIKGELAK